MKHRKPAWWKVSALAAAMALPGASMAADFSADFFSAKGWVKPGETYPFTISYDAEGDSASGSIQVVLPPEAAYSNASVTPSGINGQTLTFELGADHGAGQIIVWATAEALTPNSTIMWKNLSASATYTLGTTTLSSKTLGPKVTTLESARYGKRPFPLVMVEYQDIHHCTGNGERGGSPDPFLECTADHTAEALDEAVNSRTSGRSLWQLYQDMSFGQLSPEGEVGPAPGSGTVAFGVNDSHNTYKWSQLSPNGACTGTTLAGAEGTLAYENRIVDGWYRLPGTQNYYGADRTGHAAAGSLTGQGLLFGIDDACGPTAKITYDAAAIADPDLDYNEFDTDKDGVVDFFNVAFAGKGGNGNTGTGLNNIWPHKSDLQYYFTDENGEKGYVSNDQLKSHTGEPMFWTDNGRNTMTTTDTGIPVMVRVGPYNVNPEAAIEKMSVIAHEYGHSLGLPDFYSTGSRSTFGSWELMASDFSQFMTVFTRQEMGWVVPRPATDGNVTLRESKIDTGEIHWTTPAGDPYVLTGEGIHNADALKFALPTIKLIDQVPSGVRAWHSGSGNDFGCPTTQGHNLDFFLPEFSDFAQGASVELSFQSLYEIEWDWDYAFLMVSTDGGQSWTTVNSEEGTTLNGYNPNGADCYTQLGNGITGSSRVDLAERNSADNDSVPASVNDRATGHLNEAQWITDRFDLSQFAGNPGGIILRFGYFTDPAVANRGWFIDDLNITVGGASVYSSDFEDEEHSRIFPKNWSRVSSADGVDSDHAYYVEMRDRVSWDFDSKQQAERSGGITWQPGVAVLYTDESHGYGNTGVDNPPAQTIVDAVPDPGNNNPNLNDAAFTTADATRVLFNSCTHVDNYSTPEGDWAMPDGGRITVLDVRGLSSDGTATGNAEADLQIEANPVCDLNVAGPVLAFGADHADPDPDASYTLEWIPTEGATGANQLQEATTLGVLLADDAENGMGNWVVSSEPGAQPTSSTFVPWDTQAQTGNDGSNAFFTNIPETAPVSETSSIMTWSQPISVPATGATTLSFFDQTVGEADDVGLVEVRDVNDPDGKWEEIYSISNPIYIEEAPPYLPPLQALKLRQVDLTPYFGKTLELRFRYYVGNPSSIWYAAYGWWVDDIRIDTANWEDLAFTTDSSYLRSGLADGHYYYRVRSSHNMGTVPVPTNWSNIVETGVQYVNQAPNAVDDAFTSYQGQTEIFLDVLANDSDPEGDALGITEVSQGSNGGHVELRSPTEVYYYPPSSYAGTETFSYTLSDGNGNSDTATVTVTVEANNPPVANDDYATVGYGESVTINVLANDTDPDGDALTVTSVDNQAQHGTVTLNADNTITYTQTDPGPSVDDVFSYHISDGRGGSRFAYVHISVVDNNTAPTAMNDSASTTGSNPVTIDVLANDSDADGDALTVTGVTQPANGSVMLNGDGTVTYTADNGFVGSDSFSYTISDGTDSDTATVTVTVNEDVPPNTAPTAVNDSASTTGSNPVTIDVLGNDSDADGDALTVTGVTQPANGSAVLNGDGTVTYTANNGFVGSDSFSYTISDGTDSASAQVSVSVADPGNGGGGPGNGDGSSDDDDYDDDGSRDDTDSDDDNDGKSDDSDSDDDNDGIRDDDDSDDDNDGIDDEYDSKSHKEKQSKSNKSGKKGNRSNSAMVANPATVLLIAVVESADPSALSVEIKNAAGAVIATGVPGIDGLLATAVPTSPGEYTVSVINHEDADYELTLISRDAYL